MSAAHTAAQLRALAADERALALRIRLGAEPVSDVDADALLAWAQQRTDGEAVRERLRRVYASEAARAPLVQAHDAAPPALDADALLHAPSMLGRQERKRSAAFARLLNAPTSRQRRVRSAVQEALTRASAEHGAARVFRPLCRHITAEACGDSACPFAHMMRIVHAATDERFGPCAYLNSCRRMARCRALHYAAIVDTAAANTAEYVDAMRSVRARHIVAALAVEAAHRQSVAPAPGGLAPPAPGGWSTSVPAQWINCDVRALPFSSLGKFSVVVADPPWDINMLLPYGTMNDVEMLSMDVRCLQTDGVLFLWVTARAMELGRELLKQWGYRRVGEIVWLKLAQTQTLIRRGRTGYWLNHAKEHCLVGIKGKPVLCAPLDTDVLVAEMRETSRKPDELYEIAERMVPLGRRLEIFGRPHNTRPGWLTIGNQLDGTRLWEPELVERVRAVLPDPSAVQVIAQT